MMNRLDPNRWRWTNVALRVAAGIQAALVFTQALLAGHLLTGNASARTMHQELGTEVLTWVALIETLLAVLAWRPGRGPVWPIPLAALTFAAVITQIMFGFEGRLAIHIPLGVALLLLNLVLVVAPRKQRVPSDRVSQQSGSPAGV